MWKSTPVNVGMLIACGAIIIALVGFGYNSSKEIKSAVTTEVKVHSDKDIDRAHPDLPKRYVSKRELNSSLHKIDNKLYRIEINIQELTKSMKRKARRRK